MGQAFTLQEMMSRPTGEVFNKPGDNAVKVISVTSGKGGVGKTNVVVNLAYALTESGKNVLILDADMGLGNIDVMLGLAPEYNLYHLINGEKKISEVMTYGPGGMKILPAGSGIQELSELTANQKLNLLSELDRIDSSIDIVLIDTAAGISGNVMYFNTAAQDIIVVASPEPTSITDAYALMKIMHMKYGESRFRLLVNMVRESGEGRDVYRKLSTAADKFLNVSIDYLGHIMQDKSVRMSVLNQRPVVDLYPGSDAGKCYTSLARTVCGWPVNKDIKGNIQFLWRRLMGQSGWDKI
ncbi:MAG: MinD/ParA family protein [Nitrospirae bacterium]|nr:MinD/ParA family protein [Nitrospirota bacterium]